MKVLDFLFERIAPFICLCLAISGLIIVDTAAGRVLFATLTVCAFGGTFLK